MRNACRTQAACVFLWIRVTSRTMYAAVRADRFLRLDEEERDAQYDVYGEQEGLHTSWKHRPA